MNVNYEKIFKEHGAIWQLHNAQNHVKTSMGGKHVDAYFNSDVVVSNPNLLSEIIEGTLLHDVSQHVDWVVSYAPYGQLVAYEAAKQLAAKVAYSNPTDGFSIHFDIPKNATVLVVADDIYDGGATNATIQQLLRMGVNVSSGVYCLANMSNSEQLGSRKIFSAIRIQTKKYAPEACEHCAVGSIALLPRPNWKKLLS